MTQTKQPQLSQLSVELTKVITTMQQAKEQMFDVAMEVEQADISLAGYAYTLITDVLFVLTKMQEDNRL